MINLETIATNALARTEANALVVGAALNNGMTWCLPLWECESETNAKTAAVQMAIAWADQNGCGDVQVAWAFNKME